MKPDPKRLWFVFNGTPQVAGPHSEAELEQDFKRGYRDIDMCHVFTEGLDSWLPANKLPSFFSGLVANLPFQGAIRGAEVLEQIDVRHLKLLGKYSDLYNAAVDLMDKLHGNLDQAVPAMKSLERVLFAQTEFAQKIVTKTPSGDK